MNHAQQERMDKVGILLSLSCCIHCLATPLILMAAPAIGEYFESALIHIVLFLLVAPIALLSFLKTYKHTQKSRPLFLGIIGLSGLLIALLLHLFAENGLGTHHIHDIEIGLNIVSGLVLVAAHFFNFKDSLCKHC
ncbi:MerC domain-containing protein [Halobacteriovorax sp.]|uniref:MerC domain-containing protein n=1 Tax=Halobacteriovorax sp. TaxID=2020862 RepID=UPI003568E082